MLGLRPCGPKVDDGRILGRAPCLSRGTSREVPRTWRYFFPPAPCGLWRPDALGAGEHSPPGPLWVVATRTSGCRGGHSPPRPLCAAGTRRRGIARLMSKTQRDKRGAITRKTSQKPNRSSSPRLSAESEFGDFLTFFCRPFLSQVPASSPGRSATKICRAKKRGRGTPRGVTHSCSE